MFRADGARDYPFGSLLASAIVGRYWEARPWAAQVTTIGVCRSLLERMGGDDVQTIFGDQTSLPIGGRRHHG